MRMVVETSRVPFEGPNGVEQVAADQHRADQSSPQHPVRSASAAEVAAFPFPYRLPTIGWRPGARGRPPVATSLGTRAKR